ncbi:MAG: hypothetical protein PHW60_10380 [Kiritimatiellae bacterium]|nr:hypothetical protein [Kiritimatiellia bacterium]
MKNKVYSTGFQDWKEAIEKLDGTEPIEITKDFFDYFLGVLPPVGWSCLVALANGREVKANFLFA